MLWVDIWDVWIPKNGGAELEKIDWIGEHRRRKTPAYSIGEDYNSAVYDPIFSIWRTSFDALSQDDQLLFMDFALFHPNKVSRKLYPEWIGMVYGIPSTEDVMRALGRLKSKSLLEISDTGTCIGMHDLWRAFSVAETTSGELGCRRWVYQTEKNSELVETSPSGTCWENVKRMAFLDSKLENLERVNFSHFPNVRVLKITGVCMTKKLTVDLSGLIHLKSLEMSGRHLQRLVLQGLPRSLIYLSLISALAEVESDLHDLNESESSSRHLITGLRGDREHWRSTSRQLIEQIVCFKDLQVIRLVGYEGDKLPDMGSSVSMVAAIFCDCKNVVTLTGLSSKMINLRHLSLGGCRKLRSCPGVGDLFYLEYLGFHGCRKLKRLPNLRKLRNLRALNVSGCPLIIEVPGLGDLAALENLYAGKEFNPDDDKSSYRLLLPDMRKLSNLRGLILLECRLKAVPGFDILTSLQHVIADFRAVEERPSLGQLTKLQDLEICGWSSKELGELSNLVMLQTLDIVHCSGVDKLPDIQNLVSLQSLRIERCEFKDVLGLSKLGALKSLYIWKCDMLERLPDLQRLRGLKWISIRKCPMLRGWDCILGQVEVTNLGTLLLSHCNNFEDLTCIRAFSQLERLECSSLPVTELPDLSNFPRLKTLGLLSCESLMSLTCRQPLNTLSELEVNRCSSLMTIPDLCSFLGLLKLVILDCKEITPLSSVPLTALQELKLCYNSGLKALPDLALLPALQVLNLRYCSDLKVLPDLGMFPALESSCSRDVAS